MKQQASEMARGWTDDPTAWFITLQRARLEGDRDLQSLALRELARLGVHVAVLTRGNAEEVLP